MEKTASQIAQRVLRMVDTFNRSLYCNVQQFKLAAEKKEPSLSLPVTLALGTGAGAVTGAGYGLLSNLKNIKNIKELSGKLPELTGARESLKSQGFTNRKDLRKILTDFPFPKEDYYKLRRGYEKAFPQRSRAAKTLNALKRMARRKVLSHGLLGAAGGLGTGLLASTALGHFD